MTPDGILARCVPAFTLLIAVVVSGCHVPDPMPNIYVLGVAAPTEPTEVSELGKPVIEVKLAQLPDYLDTTDIVENDVDGRVIVSDSGRWGERLSVGVTRAVALSLAAQLPGFAVTTSSPSTAPWRQVRIDIDFFVVRPDRSCVVTAEWSIRAGDDGNLVEKQRITLVVPLNGGGDTAVVAALSSEFNTLADRIALALREPPAGPVAEHQQHLPPRPVLMPPQGQRHHYTETFTERVQLKPV